MKSVTVEFQRFGDKTGVLRKSDRYLRTVGTSAPAEEVRFELDQANLVKGMNTLDYDRIGYSPERKKTLAVAKTFLSDIKLHLQAFLPTKPPADHKRGRYQVEVVTTALELAQLPFEVLANPDLVITRRVRQPWPLPPVVHSHVPKVLFAWAAPKLRPSSQRRMEVPHERHRELFDQLLDDWGGFEGGAVVEIGHVTKKKLAEKLSSEDGFTHLHLLAHGVGQGGGAHDVTLPVDLSAEPEPSIFLALENTNGTIDRCDPRTLAAMFRPDIPRPASVAIATCQSAEVDSIEAGGTLAHVLHGAGVPVVLASQLALTQDGSDELIKTFLAMVVAGDDPREALGACRDALRKNEEKTYYDHVALVGYIHVDSELEKRLPERKAAVALARLEAVSKDAEKRLKAVVAGLGSSRKGLGPEQRGEADAIADRFASVRKGLEALEPDRSLSKEQREELRGLQASSLKREAEAAWNLSRALAGDDAGTWQERSRDALRNAVAAYARAAGMSRDLHWALVQWLVLEAVVNGTLDGLQDDWIVARLAARDALRRQSEDDVRGEERREVVKAAAWARGSLMELHLLAPLVGRDDDLTEAKQHLAALVNACDKLKDSFPITSTLRQLARYRNWWGADPKWKLPAEIVDRAKELHAHLTTLGEKNG